MIQLLLIRKTHKIHPQNESMLLEVFFPVLYQFLVKPNNLFFESGVSEQSGAPTGPGLKNNVLA